MIRRLHGGRVGSPLSFWPGTGRWFLPAAPVVGLFRGGKVLDWLLEVGTSRVILSPDSDFRTHPHLCRWGPRSISEPFLTRELESWRPSARGIDDAHQVGRPTEAYQVRDMNRGG